MTQSRSIGEAYKNLFRECRRAIGQLFLAGAYCMWPKTDKDLNTIRWFAKQPLDY